MSRLDELIQELCPDGVPNCSLSDVAEYSKLRTDAELVDDTSYVGVDNLLPNKQGKRNSEYVPTEGRLTAFVCGDVLIGNIRPYLKKIWLATHDGGTNGDVLVIHIKDRNKVQPEYLYYVLSSDAFFLYDMQYAKGAKMPRGNKDAIMDYKFSVPPLEVQSEIVRILDNFTELTAELTARKKQYEYYRDKLLSFNVLNCASVGNSLNNIVVMPLGEEDMNKLKELIQKLCSNGVEYKTIKETVGLNRGKRLTKSELLEESNTEFKYAVYHGSKDTPLGFYNNFNAPKGTTIVVNEKYLYYCLSGYEDYFSSKKRIGGVPTIDKSIVENFSIPVPPLEVQEEIVRILDKFTTLATSISEGLPKEIELRRKQYEYYRNQLLSFPDNKATA